MSSAFFSCLPLQPLILLLLLPLVFLVWKRSHGRRLPPGPRPLPIIGNLHLLFDGLPHRTFWHLSKQYGPLMHLKLGTRPAIVVSSSKLADEVMRKQDLHFCNRPGFPSYRKLSYNYLDLAFAPFGEHYWQRRKIFKHEFGSLKRVQSFGFIREEEVARMMASISRCASSSMPANLSELALALTGTIISRAAFGKSCLEGKESAEFMSTFEGLQAAFGTFFFEYYMPWLRWMDVVTGTRAKLEKTFWEVDAFYEQVIEEHVEAKNRAKEERREDVADILLGVVKDEGLTREHIKGIFMVSHSLLTPFFCVSLFNGRARGPRSHLPLP